MSEDERAVGAIPPDFYFRGTNLSGGQPFPSISFSRGENPSGHFFPLNKGEQPLRTFIAGEQTYPGDNPSRASLFQGGKNPPEFSEREQPLCPFSRGTNPSGLFSQAVEQKI